MLVGWCGLVGACTAAGERLTRSTPTSRTWCSGGASYTPGRAAAGGSGFTPHRTGLVSNVLKDAKSSLGHDAETGEQLGLPGQPEYPGCPVTLGHPFS